jgi:hypothetical protein
MTDRIAEIKEQIKSESIELMREYNGFFDGNSKEAAKTDFRIRLFQKSLSIIEDLQREVAEQIEKKGFYMKINKNLEEENTKLKEKLTWQPIDSAPKDGSFFLGSSQHHMLPFVAYYDDEQEVYISYEIHKTEMCPEFWMPLPEKPDGLVKFNKE